MSDDKKLSKKELLADTIPMFRWGTFDKAGYVKPVEESTSKQKLESLTIPEGTKPFMFPTKEGYIPVYLKGKEKLSKDYTRGNDWLCAELLYTHFEKSGSLSGKLNEYMHRVGDIKEGFSDTFSIKGNLFLVILIIFGGIAIAYSIAKALWFH